MTPVLLVAAWAVTAPPEPGERLRAIRQDVADARAALSQAQGKDRVDLAAADLARRQRAGLTAAVALAESDPASGVAFDALEWVLTTTPSYPTPTGKRAMELAAEHHADNPRLGKAVAWLGYYPPPDTADSYPAAVDLFRAVAERNPDRAARGQGYLALAWHAQRTFARAEEDGAADTDELAAAAERAFVKVLEGYADCPRLMRDERRTLGQEAEQELFELRHLRVGKTAPDLEGPGLDGGTGRLSSYRGKVTVVVFWATWCPACSRMLPAERELAARMKDQPVALLGVNGDADRERARRSAAAEPSPWPSLWNGGGGSDGPLSRGWNVRLWPTVYVLDAAGVIRYKSNGPRDLVATVEGLVREMAASERAAAGQGCPQWCEPCIPAPRGIRLAPRGSRGSPLAELLTRRGGRCR